MNRNIGLARTVAVLGVALLLAMSPAPVPPPEPPVIIGVAPNPLLAGQPATLLVTLDTDNPGVVMFAATAGGDVPLASTQIDGGVRLVQIPGNLLTASTFQGVRGGIAGTLGEVRPIPIDGELTIEAVADIVISGKLEILDFTARAMRNVKRDVQGSIPPTGSITPQINSGRQRVDALRQGANAALGALGSAAKGGVDAVVAAGAATQQQGQIAKNDFDQVLNTASHEIHALRDFWRRAIEQFGPETTRAALQEEPSCEVVGGTAAINTVDYPSAGGGPPTTATSFQITGASLDCTQVSECVVTVTWVYLSAVNTYLGSHSDSFEEDCGPINVLSKTLSVGPGAAPLDPATLAPAGTAAVVGSISAVCLDSEGNPVTCRGRSYRVQVP